MQHEVIVREPTSNNERSLRRKTMMKPFYCFLFIAVAMCSSTAEATGKLMTNIGTGTHTLDASDGSKVNVELKTFDLVDFDLGSGDPVSLNVVTVWEPTSRRFWWTFERASVWDPQDRLASFRTKYSFLITPQELVGMTLASYPVRLWIGRSTSVAASQQILEDKIFDRLRKRGDKVRAFQWHTLQEVELWDQLPARFCFDPLHSSPPLEVLIENVAVLPGGWEIALEGREAMRASVVLDAGLGLLSVDPLE